MQCYIMEKQRLCVAGEKVIILGRKRIIILGKNSIE